jgi:hypothetical protein
MGKQLDLSSATLIEVCVAKVGMKKGARVASFVQQWYMAEQSAGRELSVKEFSQQTGMTLATTYRRLGDFREVFREGVTPSDVVAHIARTMDAQRIPRRVVAQLV